jgi:hypothetical protein
MPPGTDVTGHPMPPGTDVTGHPMPPGTRCRRALDAAGHLVLLCAGL